MKIALLGSAPSSLPLAPFGDDTWKIWGCSPGAYEHVSSHGLEAHAWFEIHDADRIKRQYPDYFAFLHRFPGPVWTAWDVDGIQNCRPFPLDRVKEEFGADFLTSTVALMFALALLEDDVGEIGLWGVDMAHSSEYAYQRPALKHFIWRAREKGITVTIPPQSDLDQPTPVYSFSALTPMGRKYAARMAELAKRKAEIGRQIEALRSELLIVSGAIDDMEYWGQTWL